MAVPTNIKQLQAQSRDLTVRRVDKHTYAVGSRSNASANYIVSVSFDDNQQVQARCTCSWAMYKGIACQHVLATLQHMAALKDRKLSFWITEDDARRQKHRTFQLVGKGESRVWITSRR